MTDQRPTSSKSDSLVANFSSFGVHHDHDHRILSMITRRASGTPVDEPEDEGIPVRSGVRPSLGTSLVLFHFQLPPTRVEFLVVFR